MQRPELLLTHYIRMAVDSTEPGMSPEAKAELGEALDWLKRIAAGNGGRSHRSNFESPLTREARAMDQQELSARKVTDRQQQGKFELRGQDPRKSFFMAISVGNLDGSIEEPSGEGCEAITETQDEAVTAAKDVNESYPTLDVWIYKCVPVARVWRGKVRVDKL